MKSGVRTRLKRKSSRVIKSELVPKDYVVKKARLINPDQPPSWATRLEIAIALCSLVVLITMCQNITGGG